MTNFTQHTIESAPIKSKATLDGAQKHLGFVPNLYANMAESPLALEAYTTLAKLFEKSSLSGVEQQVVLLAISVYNGCEFCVAAHSLIAKNSVKVEPAIIDALRSQSPIADAHLQALAEFSRAVVDQRGWVTDDQTQHFLDAGYSKEQALDVIVGVGLKTLSNYTNHLTKTEVNTQFSSEAWHRDQTNAA